MNPYITQLRKDITAYQAKCGTGGPGSVLDILWHTYAAYHPIDDGHIREAEKAVEPVWAALPFTESEAFSDRIAELVTAYQRAAFLEGIQIGVQLVDELYDKSRTP